jgi:hypothetical protein
MAPKVCAAALRANAAQEILRARVLELYRQGGLSLKQIAEHPDIRKSKSTVQYIISRFKDRPSTETLKRPGRTVAITPLCVLRVRVVILSPFPPLKVQTSPQKTGFFTSLLG